MHITFIRPNMFDERQGDAMEPLAFSILASQTPTGITTALFDDRVEEIDFNQSTDLVAISVETFTAKRSYAIADTYRQKGVPVVMGGYHPTFLPDECLEHANAVVIGDGERVWKQVIQDVQNDSLKKKYQQPLTDVSGLTFSREIFRGKKYNKITPIQFGRGCKFHCDFCSIRAFYGDTLLSRPINEIVSEIQASNRKLFFVTDDNIFSNKTRARELFQALVPLKINWLCQVSIDVARDESLLKLMKEAGCVAVIVGFESLKSQSLTQMNKTINSSINYQTAVAKIKAAGLMIFGTFVFGYDSDTTEMFEKTLEFALDSKLLIAQFNPLMPMPGTPLYERLKQENRLLYDKWWLDPKFKWGEAMFKPKGMTAKELSEGCKNIRERFYSYQSIFKRLFDSKGNAASLRNMFVYLLINWVSKREVQRKTGRALNS
ncbi:MAG: B12-binding domain-containing radical SAM protein [Proteobacteria bacterium]|nr:B12-binding domain-containing radical SAM protein [Pseudomonadota bacterium]